MERPAPEGGPARHPLAGLRVVVTRPNAGRLNDLLQELGADVVRAPAIAFVDADDGGAALDRAVVELSRGTYDWLVVTSATAVARLGAALGDLGGFSGVRIAAVGPATARSVALLGATVDLLPPEAVGESLASTFPAGTGRALVLRPEVARSVVPNGLRDRGWTVDEVATYRTVPAELDAATIAEVRSADAVTFTSPSTVTHLLGALGADAFAGVVVSIGPVTTAALAALGVTVDAEASPHNVEGLVAAVVSALGAR